ncbi:MAG: IS66 family insertion sequence element accessory protein TnpB [Bdellovibrionales bacterium]|nr:IS66 family insertion sequence element accessory protein TnpB [Massilia sp.]
MVRLAADVRVCLDREPIDFRAGMNSLATLVDQAMQLDPFSRAVFAFHNRGRNRIKLLLYDRPGFWLMIKRLKVDHFVWPRQPQAVIELTSEQLHFAAESVKFPYQQRIALAQGFHARRQAGALIDTPRADPITGIVV